jgi:anhydro-N-acetylmuramic acid kinase
MGTQHVFNVIGIMSGTSLDGVDMAACKFWWQHGKWHFSILHTQYTTYSPEMEDRLANAPKLAARDLALLHANYGQYLGLLAHSFIKETGFVPDFIASHGYTVFHEPQNGFTVQIGSGAHLAVASGYKTICDFRTTDVALGGNGAPLVPIGDELLFSQYVACLNLGGFSNISYLKNNQRVAFDICPINLMLNTLVAQAGLKYDKDGQLGASGNVNPGLLQALNALPYYELTGPKSLGREFLEQHILPLFNSEMPLPDKLATAYAHINQQLSGVICQLPVGKVLLSGGGAHNRFLVNNLTKTLPHTFTTESNQLADFKEALIFAFLGVLRYTEHNNCLASVTGATRNCCGGSIYCP